MAFSPSITLSDDRDAAAATLESLVMQVSLGVVIVLHDDSKAAFATLSNLASEPKFNTSAVLAATPNAIAGAKSVIDRLPNGDQVSYEAFGHRVVSINKGDAVSAALSRADSQDVVELLRAFYCAAGTTVCDF